MMKRTISALALVFVASSAFASGTVTVFIKGHNEPKTLTDAGRLLDLVGQPRLATSWWPAAVIGEEKATATARQQQQELLGRLAALSTEEKWRCCCCDKRAAPADSGGEGDGKTIRES
ncbi:putative lipoprotein [Salmonella enterica subsp. arizonae]|uniref:Putative lipoprotein n=1 Tax=Salmonella enterica subsp. arizonae TaxID=59203 RepID=A0A379THT8_SALER|nr:putative lipoprotein [Salmonella enterica subsp. arizonae]